MWTQAAAKDEAIDRTAEMERVQTKVKREQVQCNLCDESVFEASNNDDITVDENFQKDFLILLLSAIDMVGQTTLVQL